MRVLIDTHVFIWWTSDVKKLSQRAYDLLRDPSTEAILSIISIWEMQIKSSLGKLEFRAELSELVRDEIDRNRIKLLPLSLSHIYALNNLPHHHRDPFDRILVAQAIDTDLQIVSIDKKFDNYVMNRLS